jgi:hypothetical protein
MEIDVIVSCGKNSSPYAEFLVKNMLKSASGENTFRFLFGINGCNKSEFGWVTTSSQAQKIELIDVKSECNGEGSVGHADSLNQCLKLCNAENTIIIDCDTAFLQLNWDTQILKFLNEKVVIVGTEYHKFSLLAKYINFPNVVMSIFNTQKFKELKIDFKTIPGEHKICTNEEAFFWDRPVGSKIYLDTGYQLPVVVKKAGLQAKTLTFLKPPSLGCGQEWALDGKSFFTHLKGSSARMGIDASARHWMNCVDSRLESLLKEIGT